MIFYAIVHFMMERKGFRVGWIAGLQGVGWCALLGALFWVKPFLTLIGFGMLLWRSRHPSRAAMSVFVVFCLIYLGLINVTKIPVDDEIAYLSLLMDARHLDAYHPSALWVREPVYGLWIFGLSRLSLINQAGFVLISTCFGYLPFLLALALLSRQLRLSRRTTLALHALVLFFPQLFSLSAHLMRQFPALSLLMLHFGGVITRWRALQVSGGLAIATHVMIIPLWILSYVKKDPKRPIHSLVRLGAFFLVLYLGVLYLAPHLQSVPVLGDVFIRLLRGDQGINPGPIKLFECLLTLALLLLSACLFLDKKSLPGDFNEGPLHLTILAVAILVLYSMQDPNLLDRARRYYLSFYFLAPMLLPGLIVRYPALGIPIRSAPLLSIPYFFYKIETGVWQYAPVQELLLGSCFRIFALSPLH